MHIQREAYEMCIRNNEILHTGAQTNAEQASKPFIAGSEETWQSYCLSPTRGLEGASAF